jgi:hypothetical protein
MKVRTPLQFRVGWFRLVVLVRWGAET